MSDKFILSEDLKVLCCSGVPLKKGDTISIFKKTSPNRLIVDAHPGLHKVKASSFRRCTKSKEIAE